jgi:hypothetical protein
VPPKFTMASHFQISRHHCYSNFYSDIFNSIKVTCCTQEAAEAYDTRSIRSRYSFKTIYSCERQIPSQIRTSSLPHNRLRSNWRSCKNVWGSFRRVLLEVLIEENAELGDFGLEGVVASGPGVAWVEEFRWDARAGFWNGKVEGLVGLVLDLLKFAGVDCVEDGAGVLKWATLATGGGTGSNPASVQQPGASTVLLNLLSKHLSVAHWVESQERLCEAGGEGGLWLSDAFLSTSHLGGVTRDEMEHGLRGVELGDRWENTTSIAGEENDVAWMVGGNARNLGVGDVLNWISASGVLGEGNIIVVNEAGVWVENDILEDGTEFDGSINIWLLLRGEAHALGVATTLDIEDTSFSPAVLIITDQIAVWIGGESGLAGTGKTEENGDIAILTLVCGGVKSEDIVLNWHLVEENSEHTLLHLTSVLSTEDNHLLIGEVDGN